jgi:hypothetical protein
MPSACWPLSACQLIAFVVVSSGCAAPRRVDMSAPQIPTVASIPVAPMAEGSAPALTRSAVAPSPEADRAESPARERVLPEPVPPASPAADVPPAPPPKPVVVLVDELPYRWSHLYAKESSEHPHSLRTKRGRGGRTYHPAPGIVVEATDEKDGASGTGLQRVARSAGYWPFRRCYEEGLRRDQGLAGRVSLDVSVASSGAVERTDVVSATLRDESVALCIGREATHLAFSPGESPTKAKVDVSLSTGDEPVVTPRPVLHADELREALHASWPAVEQCYAVALAKDPEAGGRLEMRFRARSSGEVVEVAEEGETRFANVDVARCVLGVYRTTRLPAARVCSARETSFGYAIHLEAVRPSSF